MQSLRFKILALAALLLVLTQLGTIAAVLYTANREVTAQTNEVLAKAGSATALFGEGRGTQLRSAGLILAGDPWFRGAVVSGNLAAARLLLDAHRRRAGIDIALLLDPAGGVLASTEEIRPLRLSFPGLIRRSQVEGIARGVLRANEHVYEVVTVPVGEEEPVAWLSLGLLVNETTAAALRGLTGLDVTLLARVANQPAVLGSSLPGTEGVELLGDLSASGTLAGRPTRLTTGGRNHVAMLLPFIPGSAEVEVLLSDPVDRVMAPFHSLRLSVLALSALAVLIAVIGAALLSRTITQPVYELVRAARRIRDGDYRQPVRVSGGGEVAVLTSAINAMQVGIAERQERITFQARFDSLTGLPNRLAALDELHRLIRQGRRRPIAVTVLVLDLVNFSEITTSLGQDLGEALLCQAAERLRASLDGRHTLARLEGDGFLVLLEGLGLEQGREVAEDLLRLLGAGLSVREVSVAVEARIGLAACPDHGDDAARLVQRASIARQEAVHAGTEIAVYMAGNEERHVRQVAILADLRRAARHEEFRLYVQPKIRLADGAVCGAEALVRWQHPTLGFLMPDQFIPIAEQSGNISMVTNWALATAVRECRLWLEEGLDLAVSVNLSGRDLQNPNLPCFILELLRDHDLPARNLIVEITEQAVVRDFHHATIVLECLRDLGIRIAVDDFGTGYSSLAQLKNLPVDELKIDRSFVAGLPENRADRAIVTAAIHMAHDLGLEVLAEGVEGRGALTWLGAHGCERAQGFLIARPMPVEQFPAWVRTCSQAEGQEIELQRA